MNRPEQTILAQNIPWSNHPNGATAVEFAVVAPVLLLLVFGLFESSRLVMVQQALTNAAREGCRKAVLATTTSEDDVKAEVRNHLRAAIASSWDINIVRVTVNPSNFDDLTSHEQVTTSVSVTYSDVSLFPPWFLGNIEMHGTAVMERE